MTTTVDYFLGRKDGIRGAAIRPSLQRSHDYLEGYADGLLLSAGGEFSAI